MYFWQTNQINNVSLTITTVFNCVCYPNWVVEGPSLMCSPGKSFWNLWTARWWSSYCPWSLCCAPTTELLLSCGSQPRWDIDIGEIILSKDLEKKKLAPLKFHKKLWNVSHRTWSSSPTMAPDIRKISIFFITRVFFFCCEEPKNWLLI